MAKDDATTAESEEGANPGTSSHPASHVQNGNEEEGCLHVDEAHTLGTPLANVGDSIQAVWAEDNQKYSGIVVACNDDSGEFDNNYNNGEKETLQLQDEDWHASSARSAEFPSTHTHEIELTPGKAFKMLKKKRLKSISKRSEIK